MPWFTGLDRIARKTGFPVVESPGWKTNGHRAMGGCQAIIIHHTATTNTTANAPTLNYVRNNKLSHFVLGRDGTIYVTGAGFQGHAGKDSLVSPAHARNATSIGIEAENNGTGEPWPDVQMESYVRLVRALIDEFNLPVSRVYGHKEIALTTAGKLGRKTDPTFNMDTFRAAIKRGSWGATIIPAAPATSTPKEDNLSAEEVRQINAHTTAAIDGLYDRLITAGGLSWAKVGHNGENLRQLLWEAAKGAQAGYVNTNAIKNTNAEVVKAVASVAQSQGLTPEQVSALIDATAKAASEGAEKGASEAVEAGVTVDITATATATKKES